MLPVNEKQPRIFLILRGARVAHCPTDGARRLRNRRVTAR
jgi:hypothetical protein